MDNGGAPAAQHERMAGAGRKYSDEQKQAALDAYAQVGARAAGRATSIPHNVISQWAKAAGVDAPHTARSGLIGPAREALAQQRADLANDLLVEAREVFLAKATSDDTPAADAKAWMVALGIAVDKSQLLSGQATARIDTLDDDERVARAAAIRDELAQRRAENEARAAAEQGQAASDS